MRVVLQRVHSAQVTVADAVVGTIDRGLLLLVGLTPTDTEETLAWMSQKCLDLRVFPQAGDGRFDRSVQDCGGEVLVVSQFTLYGDCRKGRRPNFEQAAPADVARQGFDRFVTLLKQSGLRVETGQFGAMMQVTLVNDGPVTLILER